MYIYIKLPIYLIVVVHKKNCTSSSMYRFICLSLDLRPYELGNRPEKDGVVPRRDLEKGDEVL